MLKDLESIATRFVIHRCDERIKNDEKNRGEGTAHVISTRVVSKDFFCHSLLLDEV